MKLKTILFSTFVCLACVISAAAVEDNRSLAFFQGAQFSGGAKELFGSFHGESVNYVYARPTGRQSMQATFALASVPSGNWFLHLKALDDDAPGKCKIKIELNDETLFAGPNEFSSQEFEVQKFSIPSATLRTGENKIVISNLEKEGGLARPPWFMVAAAAIAREKLVLPPNLHNEFHVVIPSENEPFPLPLKNGQQPGFKFRGTKGWAWTPQQYLSEIPYLVQFKMNFLMNCYTSMFDIEHYYYNNANANRWWEDLPAEKKAAYEKVVRACQQNGIEFCFSMNPNLHSKRFVEGSPKSIDELFKHYAWMQSLGVKWFNISLDDISQGINASNQAKVVNEIFRRLRAKDVEAHMIFCPTYYWADGTGKDQKPYLETLARELDKDVYCFWTGDAVVGKVTRHAAETFRNICGHRVFLWDNYPVNDDSHTMHLGPVIDRDPDLGEVIDGYMSNPHCKQSEINRIPLATCADYAYNPQSYDPQRSIGQAIVHLADTTEQRATLRDLVEAYPGMLVYSSPSTGFNSVQEQFDKIVRVSRSPLAAFGYVQELQSISDRMKWNFPVSYLAARKTLDEDIRNLKSKLAAKYPEP